jgi:hypothetical protein
MALSDRGIISTRSSHSVDRLKQILVQKGVALFALVDHSGEAAEALTKAASVSRKIGRVMSR